MNDGCKFRGNGGGWRRTTNPAPCGARPVVKTIRGMPVCADHVEARERAVEHITARVESQYPREDRRGGDARRMDKA